MSKSQTSEAASHAVQEGQGDWNKLLKGSLLHNHAAKVGQPAEGFLPISIAVRRPAWYVPPLTWFFRLSDRRVVKLDELGQKIWRQCDGKIKISEMIDQLAGEEQLTFHEARVMLTSYVQQLVARGVVVAVLHKQEAKS
ncbi:MAG: PqqD family protein [Verrucomicrobiales bacterium]